MNWFLDFFFPPLCLCCKAFCRTRFLCPLCWQQCAPLDPKFRCTHCFQDLEESSFLCRDCRKAPLVSIQRAYVFEKGSAACFLNKDPVEPLAAFLLYQWIQLDWSRPDYLLFLPDSFSRKLAFSFAKMALFPKPQGWTQNGKFSFLENQKTLVIAWQEPKKMFWQKIEDLRSFAPKRLQAIYLYESLDLSQ